MNYQSNQNGDQNLESESTGINYAGIKNEILPKVSLWFDHLSTPAKIVVVVGGGVLVFSLLNTIFKLVVSLISLLILASILYVIYRFAVNSKP